MKKIIFHALLICFAFSLQAQDVPEVQKALLTKRTASWCSNCGSWGWTLFEGLVEDNENAAILMAAHHSGDLTNQVAKDITNNFFAVGQPRFYLGHEDINASSSNHTSKRQEVKDDVISISEQSPIVNAGLSAAMIDGEIILNTKTRFFQEAEGEFYLGVYLLEDHVINFQANQGQNADHRYVLRASLSEDSFGPLVASGTITSGQEFENSFNFTPDAAWNTDNFLVIAIIWNKVDDKYEFVNTNVTTEFSTTNTRDQIVELTNFKVYPNPTVENAFVELNMDKAVKNAQINIYDVSGKHIHQVFRGNLSQGVSQFSISETALTQKGMYFVRLEIDGKVVTKTLENL